MRTSVAVESVIVGSFPDRLPPLTTVSVDLDSEVITARELIRRSVLAQIRALAAEPAVETEAAMAALARQYPFESEDPAGKARRGAIDAEAEVERALRAFQERRFTILIEGRRVERLEEELHLLGHVEAKFLRLVPLAGG